MLELRRPPNNFFDEELLTALADALQDSDEDRGVSCVVLCSEGKHFCAGADLRDTGANGIRRVYRQAFRILSTRKPLIAAVQGAAIGGGLGLALAADFRVAGPEARMSANFARLGFHHGFGLTVTLPRVIGQQRALELLYTGRTVRDDELATVGLCDRTAADPRGAAIELASEIAAAGPLAVPAIKATMRRAMLAEISAALDLEATAQAALLTTGDFAEGLSASIERRNPRFTGS
jgi:enoyl-CoA hydratase/carnithine racemase